MKSIIYKPYTRYEIAIYVECLGIAFIGCIFFESLSVNDSEMMFFSGAHIISLVLCLKSSLYGIKLLFFLDEKGIYIVNGNRKGEQFISWEDVSFGYYCVDYRDTPYLVLATKEMNKKQIKKSLRSRMSKQLSDGNVVICLWELRQEPDEQMEKFKKIVADKVVNIREYK